MTSSRPIRDGLSVRDIVARLVRGSIDMHTHFGPDTRLERRMDIVELLQAAEAMGMRAIVLKSRDYPTQPLATIARAVAPPLQAVGALCMEYEVGGLNLYALRASARMGAKVCWMPTFSSKRDMAEVLNRPGEGVAIVGNDGKLGPEVEPLLDTIRQYDMVLATGHIDKAETYALFDKAKSMGLQKIILTHPLAGPRGPTLTKEEQKELAHQGAYIEHCWISVMPRIQACTIDELVEHIKYVGPEHCILSTDFGQVWSPPPPEGMWDMAATLLGKGLKEEELTIMMKTNPAKLLGLAP